MTKLSDISKSILISVESELREEREDPNAHYIYSYSITIKNESNRPVQLLRRKWEIFDSLGGFREVEGAGVVGLQPTIAPGESFNYESWCPLVASIGYMSGYYTFRDLETNSEFMVEIPKFDLVPAYSLN